MGVAVLEAAVAWQVPRRAAVRLDLLGPAVEYLWTERMEALIWVCFYFCVCFRRSTVQAQMASQRNVQGQATTPARNKKPQGQTPPPDSDASRKRGAPLQSNAFRVVCYNV